MSPEAPGLPGIEQRNPVGDPRGAVYTPDHLARAIVDHVLEHARASWSEPMRLFHVLEPSIGGGAFARALARRFPRSGTPELHLTGVDINPDAPGLQLTTEYVVEDFATCVFREQSFQLCIGNPPFGKAVGIPTVATHVLNAIRFAEVVALILPVAYLCGSDFDALVLRDFPLWRFTRITARPWPDRLREVGLFEWRPGWMPPAHELDTLRGWP